MRRDCLGQHASPLGYLPCFLSQIRLQRKKEKQLLYRRGGWWIVLGYGPKEVTEEMGAGAIGGAEQTAMARQMVAMVEEVVMFIWNAQQHCGTSVICNITWWVKSSI
ncbi:uncharacterized protein LOC110104494 [Dendrobium catenatum]|uniref:uncharacterized protein LOC110104494 n=1 Tax=Dendrobium catenatum TaxID=906689 RepID=UPI0009F312E2|nr:uncharacterized protein LOC110104494 [Dendrobium catenatum]